MDNNTFALIVGILGIILGPSGIVIYLLGRRKNRAEAKELEARAAELESQSQLNKVQEANTFADATTKFLDNQERFRDENSKLYNRVVALEKMLSDSDRSKQGLAERLTDRDAQITTLTNHLKTLQDKQRDSGITAALVAQQQTIIQIADTYQKIIEEREKTMAAREETFKDLVARTGPLRAKNEPHT